MNMWTMYLPHMRFSRMYDLCGARFGSPQFYCCSFVPGGTDKISDDAVHV